MTIRISSIAKTVAVAATSAVFLTLPTAPAEAITITGTVPNFFWRTCIVGTVGCSGWSQSNPPYLASVPSICYTKNPFGQVVSQYTVAAGKKC